MVGTFIGVSSLVLPGVLSGVLTGVDCLGNWFIKDEEGNIVYTDEQGNPLTGDPSLPPENEPGQPVVFPTTPVDGNQGNPSGNQTAPGETTPADQPGNEDQTAPDLTAPEDPAEPPADEPTLPDEDPGDEEMPGWLQT